MSMKRVGGWPDGAAVWYYDPDEGSQEMFLGIDPDTHYTGLAVVNPDGNVVGVECCTIPQKVKGSDAVVAMIRALSGSIANIVSCVGATTIKGAAIEGQNVTFRTPDPSSIIRIAQVSGAAAGIVNELLFAKILIPEPRKWKGQVPKIIHQRRILEALGWAHESHGDQKRGYTIPTDPPVGKMLKQVHWKHVVDAIGLARWASQVQSSLRP
jgi:hypothetical protein